MAAGSDFPELPVLELTADFTTDLPRPLQFDQDTQAYQPAEPPFDIAKKWASPHDLSSWSKNLITWAMCMGAVFGSVVVGAYPSAKEQLAAKWGISEVAVLVGLTTFTTGFALAPMALAPISETWGRKPVFAGTGLLFVVCQICCAVTESYPGLLVARFFAGVGCSSYASISGGVISDIYYPHERNMPMGIFAGGALFGVGLGPLFSGFVVEHLSWRWTFWIQVIVDAVLLAYYVLFVPETRENIILLRRARELNKWYASRAVKGDVVFEMPSCHGLGRVRAKSVQWKLGEKEQQGGSVFERIAISAYRSFQLLFTEPVVFFFSLWAAFSWSVLYLALAAVPLVFTEGYGFPLSIANLTLVSICIASVIAVPISDLQERWLDGTSYSWLPLDSPERRLYFSCIESILLPAGLFMFGWTAHYSVHWIAPTIAIGIATAGIFSVYLVVFNYLADAYKMYASSALAAQSFSRYLIGGVLPLVTTQMFTGLGYGPAASLLGAIGLLLSIGPWVLVIFGRRIRAKSRFATKLSTH